MNSEHFGEGLVKALVKAFSEGVNTVKAFTLCKDRLVCIALSSLFLFFLKVNPYSESVHSVHLSEGSVHESVHEVFTECSLLGVNYV